MINVQIKDKISKENEYGYYKLENKNNVLNAYRANNNFGYVKGSIDFSDNCNNNLVISDAIHTMVSDVKDSFILINNGKIDIYPIKELKNPLDIWEKNLGGKLITYNIPKKVFTRENLKDKNLGELEEHLMSNYNLHNLHLKQVRNTLKKNAIFYVSSREGEYIFRHIGEEIIAENLFTITKSMSDFFPIMKETKEGRAGIELEDGIYGLEEFLKERKNVLRDFKYFRELGGYIAVMHDRFSELMEKNTFLKTNFIHSSKDLSESNLIALGIDLTIGGFEDLNKELNKLVKAGLNSELSDLPESLIHGDLNSSNVIATSNGFKFIDLERIKISKRVFELESPLIFGGNATIPSYVIGSLNALVNGYNSFAKVPINYEEKAFGISSLKYTLIKNFVIRNIRRGEKHHTKDNLLENLSLLSNESLNGR